MAMIMALVLGACVHETEAFDKHTPPVSKEAADVLNRSFSSR